MRFFDLKKVKFLSVHYQDNADTQDLAAQLLFGGSTASGILPVTVGKFKEGSGIKTDKKIRFSYIMPEKWGLSSDTLAKKIDKIVSEAIINQAFPGCEIIAAKDGFIFFKKSYGFTTYDSAQKNEENMLYDIASLTKITAALPALMRLTEQKKIRLNKDLGTYLPEYKNSNKKGIPLRELLAHQGGLKAWIPFWKTCKEANGAWKPLTFASDSSANYPFNVVENLYLHKNFRDSIFKQILESPVAEKKYVYSDLGFYLYPKIVEKKTNKFFEQYIAENFFRPLGANSFTYNPLKKFPKHKIVPTEFDSAFRKTLLHGTVNDEGAAMTGGVSGHAGLFGTANDAAKMLQMYLDKGMYGGIRFFKEKTIAEFLRCQFCEAGNRRALGFDRVLINYNEKDSYTAKSASHSSFGHTGFTGTFMWADPKNGLLVVVMSNRVNPSRNNRKLMELNIRPRLHQVFYDFFSK
jgi:CubicO group peptidase (beta-lactamase class C family)